MLDTTALPDYTQPATETLSPPQGGQLWCIWVATRQAARFLAEDLLHLATAPSFGVEVWDDQQRTLVVIDFPMTAPGIVKALVANYGRVIETTANIDVTGQYGRGAAALELL